MQQCRFRSHDANLVVGDLDTLGKCPQVLPPIAASLNPQAATSRVRERVDHVCRYGLIAGAVQCYLYPVSVRRRLIADTLQARDTVLQSDVVERGDSGFDRVVQSP